MSYVSLPYLFKFLWAPFIDRFPLPFLGRRRGWMLVTQLALAVAIGLFALQNPHASLLPVTVCATAIVFFSATQDITIDAYRTDVVTPAERGLAAAATNLGYRTAAWLASAFALVVADYFGWRPAFLILAGAMLLFCIATVRAPSSHVHYQPRTLRSRCWCHSGSCSAPERCGAAAGGPAVQGRGCLLEPVLHRLHARCGLLETGIAVIVRACSPPACSSGWCWAGARLRLGLLRSMLVQGPAGAEQSALPWLALAARTIRS